MTAVGYNIKKGKKEVIECPQILKSRRKKCNKQQVCNKCVTIILAPPNLIQNTTFWDTGYTLHTVIYVDHFPNDKKI